MAVIIDNDEKRDSVLTDNNREMDRRAVNVEKELFRTYYDEPIRVPVHDGKSYYPELPDKEQISKDIAEITKEKSLKNALDLFCYICKTQIFNDGNKRTATIYANMYMIQNNTLNLIINFMSPRRVKPIGDFF